MKTRGLLVGMLLLLGMLLSAQPICRITRYDEFSGLSQRLVKQIVQDPSGMMWVATWNGLNRFDGYRFDVVKPRVGDGTGIYSDRVSDIKLAATGNLWCWIDGRCYLFDVRTYRFIDVLTLIERRLGRTFSVLRIRPAEDGTTVMECEGNVFLTVADSDPVGTAAVAKTRPAKKYKAVGHRQFRQLGGFGEQDMLYSGTDRHGVIWLVTSAGDIYYTTDIHTPLTRYAESVQSAGKLYFTLLDRQGNVWLRSSEGAYRLSFSRYPYEQLPQEGGSQMRAFLRDTQGRLWVAGREDTTLRLFSPSMQLLGYLGADGRLHASYTSFGSAVYSMLEDSHGQIWLGSKPDGLFRLREKGGAFGVERFCHDPADAWSLMGDNVYDLRQDSRGRLWIATMKGGLNCMENPLADKPRFLNVGNRLKGFPGECLSLRRILITRAGVMLLASTNGLLAADIRGTDYERMRFRRHVGEAGRSSSLSNVAVMDVLEDSRHRVFVATESGGVNMLLTKDPLAEQLEFRHFDTGSGLASDVAFSLTEAENALWVVSGSMLMRLNPDDGTMRNYDAGYWKRQLRFSDAHPVRLVDGRWLLGLLDGAMLVDLGQMDKRVYVPRIALTSISVQNGRDSLAVNALDTLVLGPGERNLTVNFAALDYEDASEILYAFRLEGGDSRWNFIGKNRSATFLDMEPGTYQLQLRSTDSSGEWQDNVRTLTVVVTPTFGETPLAKALVALLLLLLAYGIVRTFLYIRAIKRKQRETLEAYLQLLEIRENAKMEEHPGDGGHAGTVPVIPDGSQVQPQAPEGLKAQDAAFMKRVMDFVESRLGDADVTVDDMAEAAATSRSGLNRKMKSLLGVTPAEFLKEMRIRQAAQLLVGTGKSIQEIALLCGFSDQNYFGKCFKAQKGVTPSQFREQG